MDYPRIGPRKSGGFIRQHPEIDKQWMIDNWINTSKSMRQLAEEFGVSESLIDSRRALYNLEKPYKTPLNCERFFNIEDLHTWYLGGYVPAGGYNAIELSLVGDSELKLISQIAEYYNTDVLHFGDNASGIRIAYKGVNEFFESVFNIPPGPKTYNLKVPITFPNENCAKAYFLGCMDGDGSISGKYYGFSLATASYDFILGLKNILRQYLCVECCIWFGKCDGEPKYPTICASGRKAKVIEDWMYSIKNQCFYLERKYLKYKQVNDIV